MKHLLLALFPVLVSPLLLATDLEITLDTSAKEQPISPWIYGVSTIHPEKLAPDLGYTWYRLGGNRLTAYNWENNASNAGNDYLHQSDDYAGKGPAGQFVLKHAQVTRSRGLGEAVTLQLGDWLAKDKDGPVDPKAPLETRFVRNRLRKPGGSCSYPPDTKDDDVYQEEFLRWFLGRFAHDAKAPASTLLVCLDNEPDLWNGTHPLIFPAKTTYAEALRRGLAGAELVRELAPAAVIMGPASYGWHGYNTLQDAPDRQGRHFLEFYLEEMRKASEKAGVRLLDALSIHFYSEAEGDGVRVVFREGDPRHLSPACVEARLQAPRSLWDSDYIENSWITKNSGKSLCLIPAMKARIARHFPGTALAINEYNYGGGDHISGALALLDALGIFAREGVDYACLWPEGPETWHHAAMHFLRNTDGKGHGVGDRLVPLRSSNTADFSAYAYRNSGDGRLSVLVINKRSATQTLRLAGLVSADMGKVACEIHRLEGDTPKTRTLPPQPVLDGVLESQIPAHSATLFVVKPAHK